jgi:hypothetical protein
MLFLAFALFVLLLYRTGQFREYLGYRELVLLEEHILQAYDDAEWEDRMSDFRAAHPRLQNRSYMSLGKR